MTANELKAYAHSAGAMGCGVASIDRFGSAPEGFRPTDIFSKCQSVVVTFRQMPAGAILAENPIPYTHAAYKMYEEMDRLSMDLLRFCQTMGVDGVIIPADVPYLYWDDENKHGRGILSLKHAAVQAGLGIMGRSTIFINRDYGNMVYLGAILIDAQLEPDPLIEDFACPAGCDRCRQNCPQQAIGEKSVNQKLCRERSFFQTGRGWDLYNCNACRRLCPLRLGLKKKPVMA
ncbi:epoxyqueuosine reductase [Eubacteriales bacterium OttesenSCG-928-K08]|nr:epoxyqueuosine reductase [Eubacteriales bacterium OttesenSCG-928-K08]